MTNPPSSFAPGDPIQTAAVRGRYRAFLELRAIRSELDYGRLGIAVLLLLTVILAPFGVWQAIKAIRSNGAIRRDFQEEIDFIKNAELVFAAPIMVNTGLLKPGCDDGAPGIFLIDFQQRAEDPLDNLFQTVLRIAQPPAETSASERQYLASLTEDLKYRPGRRRRLPKSVSNGRTYYAVDLALSPEYLAGGYIDAEMPIVPCLAEPGEKGRIRLIPYWTALDGIPAPKQLRLGVLLA